MIFETGVTETLKRRHTDPLGLEGEHAHEWRVTVWYAAEPLRDGRALRASLRMLLDTFPDPLPPELWAAEAWVPRIALLAGVVGVDVDRAEGFRVRWRL